MRKVTHTAPMALIVDDVAADRERAVALLEETELDVITCASGEAAVEVLQRCGEDVAMLFTGPSLAGSMDGVQLARAVGKLWPAIRLVVTSDAPDASARDLPDAAICMKRPWLPLDVLVQAGRAVRRPQPLVA
ncbi:response regulator [Methylobacterium nigriterrae]|uniref:response regulator n=1 Tax=Methylobacterium nigriterrae TaxID=3127512 RepID=UPI00301409E3